MEKQIKINLSSKEKYELISLAKKYSLDLFILFGSRAKGTAKKISDYDLAYSRSKIFTLSDSDSFQKEIFKILDYKDVDLIEISQKTPIILKLEILRNGVLLYTSSNKYYNHMKNEVYFDYIDSQYLLEPTKEKFLSSSL